MEGKEINLEQQRYHICHSYAEISHGVMMLDIFPLLFCMMRKSRPYSEPVSNAFQVFTEVH